MYVYSEFTADGIQGVESNVDANLRFRSRRAETAGFAELLDGYIPRGRTCPRQFQTYFNIHISLCLSLADARSTSFFLNHSYHLRTAFWNSVYVYTLSNEIYVYVSDEREWMETHWRKWACKHTVRSRLS